MDLSLKIQRHEDEGFVVIICIGKLDTYNCGLLRSTVTDLIEAGTIKIVIDLREIEYIDVSGLGSIVGVQKRLSDLNGKLVLVIDKPEIMRVFEITGLHSILTIKSSRKDAIDLISECLPPNQNKFQRFLNRTSLHW